MLNTADTDIRTNSLCCVTCRFIWNKRMLIDSAPTSYCRWLWFKIYSDAISIQFLDQCLPFMDDVHFEWFFKKENTWVKWNSAWFSYVKKQNCVAFYEHFTVFMCFHCDWSFALDLMSSQLCLSWLFKSHRLLMLEDDNISSLQNKQLEAF